MTQNGLHLGMVSKDHYISYLVGMVIKSPIENNSISEYNYPDFYAK